MTAVAAVFVAIAVVFCALALLAMLGIGHLALSGSDALERDGLARGRRAPAWSLTDTEGAEHVSPPKAPLQLIVFADHSLKSFPSVAAGLRSLRDGEPETDLEIVIMTRGEAASSAPLLRALGLGAIRVVTGAPALYGAYNVRVMPFAIFVDSAGRVRASSLVNHDWQVAMLRKVAGLALEAGELADRKFPRTREGLAGRRLFRTAA